MKLLPDGDRADLVLKNGVVYTVDVDRSVAQAMAVRGDRIVCVGTNDDAEGWIDASTKVVDLEGRLVLPGLVDSHAHASLGVCGVYEVPLHSLDSVEACQRAIAEFIADRPGLTALRGTGWINSVLGEHGPTAAPLDVVCADLPAALQSEDGHSVWVNSKTLRLAGVTTDTPNPVNGVIERDADGSPSGTLRESAVDLIANVLPAYTVPELIAGLHHFQELAHSVGLTMAYNPLMNTDPATLQAPVDFDASESMTIRLPTAIYVDPENDLSVAPKIAATMRSKRGDHFEIIGAKLFLDGVLEGMTAYFEAPYDNRPQYRGQLLWDPRAYNEMCAALDKAGVQIHVHSIGDAATHVALDGFAYAVERNGKRDSRHMITHVQLVDQADIARFADLGVIAVPQPYWFVVDTYYKQAVEYLGKERADLQYPMKSFFDAGVVVASASDYPVTLPPDPMQAIEIGVTRTAPEGSELFVGPDYDTALNPSERITVAQMIESFTINGARAVFKENELGSLEVGKLADFVVLSQNLLEIDPRDIHKTIALLTYSSGKEVYRSEQFTY